MDTNILEKIDPRDLGRALQEARKKRKMKQEDAASIIGVARTTITAIEQGERRIRPGELIKLAHAYGRQVSDFVRPRPQLEPFRPVQFRGPYTEHREEIQPAIDLLEALS